MEAGANVLTKKYVRCIVCGEIMEEGTLICPVCGVGPDKFVPYEPESSRYHKDTKEVYIILGQGIAALSAATAIRERNSTCGILMISEENELPYNRPMLTKGMSKGISEEAIVIHDRQWYEEQNILLLNGKKILAIHPDKKEIQLQDGMAFMYDKCIYALGATSFIPPYKGAQLPEVVAVRSIQDAKKVRNLAQKSMNAVVIGGGILGLETAWEIHKIGCKVCVVEMAPRIMPRQIGPETSQKLKDIAQSVGITIITAASVEEISGETHAEAVKLADGTLLSADMVVVSCGIRANTEIAAEAGIAIGRAVLTDANMRTNYNEIYACGDCAEFEGINYALWTEATQMGKVAGANACGELLTYQSDLYPVTFHGMNTTLYAIGDNGGTPEQGIHVVPGDNNSNDSLELYYLDQNAVVGAALLGDTTKASLVEEAVKGKRQFNELFLNKTMKNTKGETKMEKYICNVCGYEYDEAKGEPDNGIAPGTKFADLPADYVCPICGAGKDEFEKA